MTTTFKELVDGAFFRVPNIKQIIANRGDKGITPETYEDRYGDKPLVFRKRDRFGGHILKPERYTDPSVFYRIEPNNVVETV